MRPIEDIIGRRFGTLVVEKYVGFIDYCGQKRRIARCKCDCGNTTNILCTDLLRGRKKTCGKCDWHKRSPRLLNGYRVIYNPDWPSAMKDRNYNGYVYEHRYVMELEIGRTLKKTNVFITRILIA